MIALSRGIPLLLRWLVQSLLEHLPQNIMTATLSDTRNAVTQDVKSAGSGAQPMRRAAR
jgi:hypothetical protein